MDAFTIIKRAMSVTDRLRTTNRKYSRKHSTLVMVAELSFFD